MLKSIPSTTTVFLVVFLQFSVAAADSSEISSEDLIPSQDADHRTDANREGSQDDSSATHHWVSDFRDRLQELSTWLDQLNENYVARKFAEVSPKSRGSLLRMPRGFGKRQSQKDDVIGFLRTSKSQLSRMPISFGKRDVFDIAMNNLYGQKLPDGGGESKTGNFHAVVNKDDFSRTRKGKLGRMPMAFGKRSGKSEASDGELRKNNVSKMQKEYSFDYRPIFDDGFERVAKDKLGRMPIAFGKRSGTSIASGTVLRKINIPGADNTYAPDYWPILDDEFERVAKDKLGRMPMAYGKRTATSETSDTVLRNNNVSEMLKEYALDFRPVFDDGFIRVAKDRLGRMPMAYGKRIPHNGYASYVESQKHTLSRPYLNTGKPAMGGEHNDQLEDVIVTKVSDDMVSAGSEDDAKLDHEDSSLYSRLSRGSLNRMPLSFGKRSVPDKMAASLNKKAEANGHAAVRAERSSRIFGKRDPNKYQVLFQMLGSKFNSPKPEIKDSVHGKIKTLLNRFLQTQSSLTRLPRSKLDRMPITYGKRSQGYSGQVRDVTTMYSRVTRPKLGRMPLTFGKRVFYPRDWSSLSKIYPLSVGVHPGAGEVEGNRMSGSRSSGDAGEDSAPGCVGLTDVQHEENNTMCKSKQRKQR